MKHTTWISAILAAVSLTAGTAQAQIEPDPPICNAGGPYKVVKTGSITKLKLDGSRSRDENGVPVTLYWEVAYPSSEIAWFEDPTAVKPMLFIVQPSSCTAQIEISLTVSADHGPLYGVMTSSCSTVVQMDFPAVPMNYCTPGTTLNGCQAVLSTTGAPSASASSGFVVTATNAEGARSSTFFFGTHGRQANPWGFGSGFQCVVPPVRRTGVLQTSGNANTCEGTASLDLNALWGPGGAKPHMNPGFGSVVQLQFWYRCPHGSGAAELSTTMSDAIEFCVGP